MKNITLQGLFPVPLMVFDLSDEGFTEEETNFCLQQYHEGKISNNIGNFRGLDGFVLNNPALARLNSFIDSAIDKYADEVLGINNTERVKIHVTQSWLNFSPPKTYHHKHTHPNSYISGVMYIKTEESDKIMFHSPYKPYIFQCRPDGEYTIWNSPTWWYPARQGTLILFPSTFEHEVPMTEGTEIRTSLSFNTFFKGTVGSEIEATWLGT